MKVMTATEYAYVTAAIEALTEDELTAISRAMHECGMEGSSSHRAKMRRVVLLRALTDYKP